MRPLLITTKQNIGKLSQNLTHSFLFWMNKFRFIVFKVFASYQYDLLLIHPVINLLITPACVHPQVCVCVLCLYVCMYVLTRLFLFKNFFNVKNSVFVGRVPELTTTWLEKCRLSLSSKTKYFSVWWTISLNWPGMHQALLELLETMTWEMSKWIV